MLLKDLYTYRRLQSDWKCQKILWLARCPYNSKELDLAGCLSDHWGTFVWTSPATRSKKTRDLGCPEEIADGDCDDS